MPFGVLPGSPKSRSTKDMVLNAIRESEEIAKANKNKELINERTNRINESAHQKILSNIQQQTSRHNKYANFTEQVKDQLLESAIYALASSALKKIDEANGSHIMEDYNNESILHSMIFQFIHENDGASALLGRMKRVGNTYYLGEVHNIITEHYKKILEATDKNDPNMFKVDGEVTASFNNAINSEDTDIMSETISDRVINAIEEFVESNAKDKEDIVGALTATKEKLDTIDDDRQDLKESYSRIGKRAVLSVRSRKHGLFNEMVSSMTKEVMNNPNTQDAFMEGTNINIGKVVDKVTILYSFLEAVNTMCLKNITPEYIREHVMNID